MKLWIVAAVSTLRLPSTAALRVPSAVVSRRALGELASAAALATAASEVASGLVYTALLLRRKLLSIRQLFTPPNFSSLVPLIKGGSAMLLRQARPRDVA